MAAYEMPKVGDVIAGKYELEKVAGEGGMGLVYAAQHRVLRQRVAVKVLLPEAAQSDLVVERFSREARAGARIQSEHVARVMDAGSTDTGAPFLVMEYLEGCDLEELLELDGKLEVADVVDYMLQALEALAHAHAVGIVHRDLKPANLFLASQPDGKSTIKMLDFGISKAIKATREEKVLTGQAVLGSPVYMSPEQLRNSKEIDGRADLWSLGVVAYEMLAGRPPFDGDGVGEIFAAILEKDPEPVRDVNPLVPAEVSAILTKCLARKPEERWADAAALARALVPFGSGRFDPVVEKTEQILARAKRLSVPETPVETRRVVDAMHAATTRVRTTRVTKGPMRLPASRLLGAAAVIALVVVGGSFAARAAVRAGRLGASSQASAPANGAAAAAGLAGRGGADPNGAPAGADPAADSDDSKVAMDLPASAGQTGVAARANAAGTPRRRSSPAPRPKFLNSRE